MSRFLRWIASLLMSLIVASPALAHQSSLSYVDVERSDSASLLTVKLSFVDLEAAIGVDANLDGAVTWRETRARLGAITAYVDARLDVETSGSCRQAQAIASPIQASGEDYLALRFDLDCPTGERPLQVRSDLFRDVDPSSRTLARISERGTVRTKVAAPLESTGQKDGALPDEPSHRGSFVEFFVEGMSHLFGGLDHMLFLLVLMVPAVLTTGGWRAALIAVLLPVTGFTLGHALTLTSAASGFFRPPSQLVEILIAATILVTAIDNVWRFLPGPRSLVAVGFGLVHGFGFSGALGALNLEGWAMAEALLGFNIGIEAGQAAISLLLAPLLYMLREPARRFHILPVGVSAIASGMAMIWIAERTGLLA